MEKLLFYKSAIDWMWNYCIYLGPFVDSKGNKYDLGIHIDEFGEVSAANVFGDNPGDYYSGDIYKSTREHYVEVRKRAISCGIISQENSVINY